MHRRPCSKLDYNNNECTALAREFNVFKSDCWKPSHFRGHIRDADIPRGSTCLLIQARIFFSNTHSVQGQLRLLLRCRVGPTWVEGLCSSFMGSASLWWWAPLSMPPVDLHHSGLSIKPPFTKPKQGKKEGMRDRREGNAVKEVRKGKRRWEEEIHREADEG